MENGVFVYSILCAFVSRIRWPSSFTCTYDIQGAAALGLRSKDYVVLAALKRSAHELSSYQKKIFKVDDHIGIAISGLTADARSLAK